MRALELTPPSQVASDVSTRRDVWLEQVIRVTLHRANEAALSGRVGFGQYLIYRLGLQLARLEGDQASVAELEQLRDVELGGAQ